MRGRAVALRLTLTGAAVGRPIGFGRQETAVSYIRGSDPAGWYPRVPVWSGVRVAEVWPGMDLELVGEGAGPVFRLTAHRPTVAGEAGLLAGSLRVEGAVGLSLTPNGQARAETALGPIDLPLFEVAGVAGAVPASRSRESRSEIVGNEIRRPFRWSAEELAGSAGDLGPEAIEARGAADLAFATFLGGSGDDYAAAVARDAAGSFYLTGYTASTDLPTTPGVFQPDFGGGAGFGFGGDAYVAAYVADGQTPRYLTYVGGSDSDFATALAVDGAGSVYLTGQTASRDFPTTRGVVQPAFGGLDRYGRGADAFVTKLSPNGTSLAYSTYLGGPGDTIGATIVDSGNAIAVDSAGSAHVAGYTNSDDFPTTPDARQGQLNASAPPLGDAFFSRLNPTATGLLYSTYLGGLGDDVATGLARAADGAVYLTGSTNSTDFPVTAGAFQRALGGGSAAAGRDAFVVRLDDAGANVAFATYLGGSDDDTGAAIAVDATGQAHVVGSTASTDFPTTTRAFQTTGRFAAFATKLDPAGGALVYSTYLGGSGQDDATAVALDSSGYLYVAGVTSSADFPVTAGAAFQASPGGEIDGFLAKLDPPGTGLLYGTYLGGRSNDIGRGLTIDGAAAAYLAGNTTSTNFPWKPGGFETSYDADRLYGDIFLAKLWTATSRRPDVMVVSPDPATGPPGGFATAFADVTNTGLATAAPVTVTATLAPDLDYRSAGPIPNVVSGQTITWTLSTLAYRETTHLYLAADLPETSSPANSVITWTVAPADPESAAGRTTATTPVLILPERNFLPLVGRSG